MNRFEVDNLAELTKLRSEHESNGKSVIILFTGSKNANGQSWCPDCVQAEPKIAQVVQDLKDESSITFITASVGDMQTWRNPSNEFRKHGEYALTCVPTLYNTKQKARVEEGGCADSSLVFALFKGLLVNSNISKEGTCEGGVCRIR